MLAVGLQGHRAAANSISNRESTEFRQRFCGKKDPLKVGFRDDAFEITSAR